jgi:hypothetical protein
MPASQARDHRSEASEGRHLYRRVVYGESQTHLTQNQAALDACPVIARSEGGCKSSRADHFQSPQSIVSDALLSASLRMR